MLGCPVHNYAGMGKNGQSCSGWYFSSEIVMQLQNIWYLRDHITNILDESNIISEVFFHRKTWEVELQKVKEQLRVTL